MARNFSKAFYNSKEWKVTREYILKRDNYYCMKCGAPALEVHHIIHLKPEYMDDPSITMNPANLISLCKDCHFKEHYRDKADGHRRKPKDTEIDTQQYYFDETGQLVQKSIPPVES